MNPIIFLRTAWMINYQGVTATDIPNGAGSYVADNQDGGEVANFLPIEGKYYGYARIRKGNDLRIERLGASSADQYVDDVTVVFIATNPNIGGQYVVGWYDNARLFRSVQYLSSNSKRKGHADYLAVTSKAKGTLLPMRLRKFETPADGPGQTNAWYVSEYRNANTFLKKFFEFKRNPADYKVKMEGGRKGGSGWQLDAEKRKRIEIAAMDATAVYFEEKGFDVKYVHNDKLGWDMEARKGKSLLLLEVKGTSQPLNSILLTPNEYLHCSNKTNYRICILENALDKSKTLLHICKRNADSKIWISETGEQLLVKEIKSAQLVKIDN